MTDASIKGLEAKGVDGSGLRVVIIRTRWNPKVVNALVEGCKKTLTKNNVAGALIEEMEVPGAYELPFAAKRIMEKKQCDAVVCIGCLIKGSTMHFEYICDAVAHGFMKLQLEKDNDIPIVYGVLNCLTEDQALERAGLTPTGHNHGEDWATAAIEMARFGK